MEYKMLHNKGENASLISTKFNHRLFLASRTIASTLAVVVACLLSLTGVEAKKLRIDITSTQVSPAGTAGSNNQPCVLTFAPRGGGMELSDPSSLRAGYGQFGGYDRGGYEYSQEQQSLGDYRRIVSVDAGCALGTQQLEAEVNKLVGQGFEVYAMGAVQPGQVVVMLRQPTLKASAQN